MRPSPLRHVVACALLFTGACTNPQPPVDPVAVEAWISTTDTVLRDADAALRGRLRALAAVAMFESFAASGGGARSLAGQVNGLWSVPASPGGFDPIIAAAEAQRVVLGSVLAGNAQARRKIDSLAAAQVAARRGAGVRHDVSTRSVAHGGLVGRAVLALVSERAPRTLVLRHPHECRLTPDPRADVVVPQGGPDLSRNDALSAAERHVLDALAAADLLAAPPSQGLHDCVTARVRTRLRTRSEP